MELGGCARGLGDSGRGVLSAGRRVGGGLALDGGWQIQVCPAGPSLSLRSGRWEGQSLASQEGFRMLRHHNMQEKQNKQTPPSSPQLTDPLWEPSLFSALTYQPPLCPSVSVRRQECVSSLVSAGASALLVPLCPGQLLLSALHGPVAFQSLPSLLHSICHNMSLSRLLII